MRCRPVRTTANLLRLLFVIAALLLIACNASTPATASPTTTPRADSLSENQVTTLASLKKVDDHPLYTMRYVGAYDTRQSFFPPLLEPGEGRSGGMSWACSLFAALGDTSNMFYGRNFDWTPASPAVLLFTEPPNGYASVSMVDIAYLGFTGERANNLADLPIAERRALLRAPWLPFDGMNARGLAVGMAAVSPGNMKPDSAKETIDSLMVIRKMLDSAATVEEAVAIVQRYNIDWGGGPPLHYLIADPTGRAVLIEFYQGKLYVIPNENKWHLTTNFLRSSPDENVNLCGRYSLLSKRLTSTAGQLGIQDAMNLLHDVAQANTQWSIVYGMSRGEISVTMGNSYETPHRFNLPLTR